MTGRAGLAAREAVASSGREDRARKLIVNRNK